MTVKRGFSAKPRRVWPNLAALVGVGGLLVPGPAAMASTKNSHLGPPVVVSVTASPRALPWGGGRVLVTAPVRRAETCQLEVVSSSGLTVFFSHTPSTGCHSGQYSGHPLIGPNLGRAPITVLFKLVAQNMSGNEPRTFRVLVAAHPLPPTTTTTVPPTTTTTVPPPTTTAVPGPTGLGSLASSISMTGSTSYNWAGYSLSGGPFTGVEGTFTVAAPTSAATCSELMNESVGIDGVTNTDIIRAGVSLSQLNPNTGNCVGGHNYVSVFWGTNTGAQSITSVLVNPGDSVTVVIWQVSVGNWAIKLTDDTNKESFTTTTAYSGPGSSAEWLVETPTDTADCGQGEDPSSPGICQAIPFSSPITFSNVQVAGTVIQADDTVMQQNEASLTPTTLGPNGFSITYS